MAKTPEGLILDRIVRGLNAMKAAGEPLWYLKIHGSAMQKAGVPDLCLIYHGRPVFLEVKALGGQATKLQMHRIGQIRAAGGVAEVVRSWDVVRDLLHLVKNNPTLSRG